jgi:TolB-like protein
MSLYTELKRRNVIRVGAAYVVTAWLIIQVVETIFPAFGFGDAAVRVTTIVLAIGLLPALILAWAFELTPEGLKKDADVDHALPASVQAGKRLDRLILVILALALGYFAFDKWVLDPVEDAQIAQMAHEEGRTAAFTESYGDKSIAVLPFVNMSDDAGNEYFSDGISEELLNLLAQIPELRVISRSSAFSFKEKDIPIPAIAEQLNVAHILEGSVRKAGNRVRITAQLIEARSDTHLWSATYDRDLDDVFAIQDEIASVIGESLKVELELIGGEPVSPESVKTASMGAYEAYLRGREFLHLRERKNIEVALGLFERSVSLDEGFAPAHAQLAITTLLRYGLEDRDTVERHLDRAQAIEPDLAEAHGGRALLALNDGDQESTIKHAQRALAANPNYVDAMNWLYIALTNLGRNEEAEATIKRLLVADPLSSPGRYNYTGLLGRAGRFEEARAQADRLLSYNPGRGSHAHAILSFFQGDIAKALAWTLKAKALDTMLLDLHVAWPLGFSWIGEYGEARRIQEQFTTWVEFADGNPDRAITLTRESLQAYPQSEVELLAELANLLYMASRFEEALPVFERFLEVASEQVVFAWHFHMSGCFAEFDMRVASTRRILGDEEGALVAAKSARQRQAEIRSDWMHSSWLHRADAMIAAFDRKPDAAVKSLKQAIRNGHRSPWFFDDPIFDDMRMDAGFIAVQQELDTILADEHNKVLQIICFNNPAPDTWQPLPETCEGVLEQPIPGSANQGGQSD